MKVVFKTVFLSLVLVVTFGCGDDTSSNLDGGNDGSESDLPCRYPDVGPKGSCASDKLTVFEGNYKVVIRTLEIGEKEDGFDLNNVDCDNDIKTNVDNVLWTLGALVKQELGGSMEGGEVTVPFEFFDLEDLQNDDCVNFALYYGDFPLDRDGDEDRAGGAWGNIGDDCNDNDENINSGATESVGNGVDDDCDGLADEDESVSPAVPSQDTSDMDADGQTIADGDCDDRLGYGESIKLGATEICGDGVDNDCNGFADDGCLPWTQGMTYPLQSDSLNEAQDESRITFTGATITDGHLNAGPSVFRVPIAIAKNDSFELNLTHVFIEADLLAEGSGIKMDNCLLSGVLNARNLDEAPNLLDKLVGSGSEGGSLLDLFIGPAGSLLALPHDAKGNRIPDIDVDGDGIERFEDRDLDDDPSTHKVDTCIDGDGTVIQDEMDTEGKVTKSCTSAKDDQGNWRFVDGWSIAIKFTALPTAFEGITQGGGL